jgi:signal transduction histidine kinase
MPARHASRWWLVQAAGLACVQLLGATPLHGPLLSCNLSGPASLALPQRAFMQILFDVAIALMFQALAFGVGALARMEQRRRAELGTVQREMLAARQLIGEGAALQERLRVARELHDSVGHHLTVMKLHLDLAMRQSVVTEPLRHAAQLTQELLAEVRAVIRAERGASTIQAVEGDTQ